jgi:hypothetical protein
MAVDPPEPSTKDDANNEGEVKEESRREEVGHEDGADNTVKAKTKSAKGRPKKTPAGSKGKGKAKG